MGVLPTERGGPIVLVRGPRSERRGNVNFGPSLNQGYWWSVRHSPDDMSTSKRSLRKSQIWRIMTINAHVKEDMVTTNLVRLGVITPGRNK